MSGSRCRLQLQPLPVSLRFSEVTFPVSFADWPCGSASQFQRDCQWIGFSDNAHYLPDAPFSHGVEVISAEAQYQLILHNTA